MNLFHFRYRDRLALLASGVLEPFDAEWVLKHVADCDGCQAELSDWKRFTANLGANASVDRELPISSDALRTRVLARIRSESAPPVRVRFGEFAPALSALGLVGIGLVAGVLITRMYASDVSPSAVASVESSAEGGSVMALGAEMSANDAAFYERLEKTQLRANAARYLAEAQDVLIQVTAAADCPESPRDSVDVTRESHESRTLLKRRAALVSGSGETLLAARGVMEEVEGLLQQVADLPHCTRRTDVAAIARKVDRRNLMMKIEMVSQELAAP
jgi:hypothetical protein